MKRFLPLSGLSRSFLFVFAFLVFPWTASVEGSMGAPVGFDLKTDGPLQNNQSIRALIIAKYIDWQVAVTNFPDVGEGERILNQEGKFAEVRSIADIEKKIPSTQLDELEKQWQTWEWLHGAGNTAEDIANFYTLDRSLQSKNLVEQFNLTQFASAATKDEIVAIHRFTVNNFELTQAVYEGGYNAVQQSWVNLIKSGLSKMSATNKFVGKVYRGSNLTQQHLQPFIDAWKSASKTIIIPAFQSCSKLKSLADDFIQDFKVPNRIEVMFEIESKTGVYIDDISDYGKHLQPTRHPTNLVQEEVLLFDNGQFRITNFEPVYDNGVLVRYKIQMEEL